MAALTFSSESHGCALVRYLIKMDLKPILSSDAVADPSPSMMIPNGLFQTSLVIAAMAVLSAREVAVELPVRYPRPAYVAIYNPVLSIHQVHYDFMSIQKGAHRSK
jgi:hypothetical protein